MICIQFYLKKSWKYIILGEPGHVSTLVCVPSDLLKQDGQVEATDGLYAVTSGGGGGV
jgi:hypothetical protein